MKDLALERRGICHSASRAAVGFRPDLAMRSLDRQALVISPRLNAEQISKDEPPIGTQLPDQ
jgi:hypothetical protein